MRPVRLGNVSVPPVTFAILVALVLCFIAAGIGVRASESVAAAFDLFPVRGPEVLAGQVWRLFTYALLHSLADPFHLIFNCLFIYMFGRELEDRWGSGRMAVFFVASVVVGGIFVVAASVLGLAGAGALGASAFAQGLIVAYGLTYRDRPIRFMFMIQMKGIHLVWVSLGLWVLEAVSFSATSAAAHLGGMVAAAVLVLGVWRPNYMKAWLASLREKVGGKKQPQLFVVPRPPSRPDEKKWVN